MCLVSNVGDIWGKTVPDRFPWIQPLISPLTPPSTQLPVTRAEFEALRAEMQELKKLLEAAKAYDKATGQPDCEMDSKVALIKKLAGLVGVDMANVFPVKDGGQ